MNTKIKEQENIIDNFKLIEKSIKNLIKKSQNEIIFQKKKKKKDDNNNYETNYCWNNLIDPRLFSVKLEVISSFTSTKRCLSNRPHLCLFDKEDLSPSLLRLTEAPTGLFIISNALCLTEQLYWARKCVTDYADAEYTNLENLETRYNEKNEKNEIKKEKLIENNNLKNENKNLFQFSSKQNNNFSVFKKLRWSCLGYHYDWTERCYSENAFTPFPSDLSSLSSHLINLISEEMKKNNSSYSLSLLPEAAIINYYPISSSMGGHIDDSEHNLVDPIISFSLGTTALFLLGTHEKSFSPHAFVVRSGDVVVMSEEARIGYHGVPSLLSKKVEDHFLQSKESTFNTLLTSIQSNNINKYQEIIINEYNKDNSICSLHSLLTYLSDNRLNMNIRQVKHHTEDAWIEKKGKTTHDKLKGAIGINQL